ncbi:inhibitor of nuclear factor kappa-B kinase subunit alpha-like isoform X1 [Syngnathoides biaculeatus]|uniref:inhibitor of nuclear factor kappa-B kinase subunit alpha-like isoform X1 n=1 Tax=Syngnathoides biaculeatus TaxID=300417 RepID=UPI002ADE2F96|nr:inhibitor of nuclear factor kappa-B kinase subunit alpha-like isoform X1 [Syngnathoides biaculeatus]XP_061665848.1 inhibitor of nuclear factor kappa-B kinase subunit alpha-like isoform X1 [Syngnathoides biaculeatus]XP_061665849.1 inhibitor of nuclear factor kappa-B kinase subunit alpha-like isoform X1 [Syngnathoides biaculeatus]
MEKPPFRHSHNCGDWELKERLGMGGFAHVYLYQHQVSAEKLAVKMCRLELTPRNKDRWSREIQIMKKLNHINVVTARDVPREISLIALNDLPLLAMEYCSHGDLRKVLSRPENCCGLKESDVLALLNDVGSGIQYLHENKIIHRDLKPENIVLQEINGKLVHKIIDLGYAKDLDQGSLCTSFVGTLQYLAPELFENKAYTVSVDYWSFGTMIFECSCGFRPFLHNLQPVQWASKVRNKGPKDIMAVEEPNGEVRFSTHLPYPNNLSRTLLEPMEALLQLMLKWDPVHRGGGVHPESRKPLCFHLLDQILNMKAVHVLNMTTAQVHSFQLAPDESLHALQKRLETESGIHVVHQELLQETGVSLDPRKPAAQCVLDGVRGWDAYIVYLFDKSATEYSGPFSARQLPDKVNTIVQEARTPLPLGVLKKVWAEALSYICGLKDDYSRLFQGQRAAMLSLLRYNTNLTRCKNSMFGFSQQLKAKLDFFRSSIQYDLEKYSDQMHYGISSEKMLKAWQENEERAAAFAQVAEVSHLDDEIMALHSEIVELQRSPYARRQGDKMEQLGERAMELYKQLKLKCKVPEADLSSDSSEMVKAIIQTVQNQDKVLKDLYTHLSKILSSKQKIIELFPRIEKTLESIKEADHTVMQMQIKRQREFWHLLKIACAQNYTRNSLATSPEAPSQWTRSAPPGSAPHPLTSLPGPNDSDAAPRLLQETQKYLSQLTSLMQEAADEQAKSMVAQDWSWTKYETLSGKFKKRNA